MSNFRLRVFHAVATHLNFSRAAEILFISQPAVTKNIKELETELDVKLFDRVSKRGLTLTLFLIGAGLTKDALRSIGLKPLVQGVLLWAFISVLSLVVILYVR